VQEKVYKTRITDVETMNNATDETAAVMTTWSSLAHSVLSRCFSSSRSV